MGSTYQGGIHSTRFELHPALKVHHPSSMQAFTKTHNNNRKDTERKHGLVRIKIKDISQATSSIHSTCLYLVKRLYNTRSVDFRSQFTISSGLGFGLSRPPSCISSKENDTLCTF